ncbi:DUF2534 family protein [Siccibacter colletis]|jgi:hypothetical protein|uniref:DUF2534 family protein n=1 Tax=Siccibacter colletis TaxID=1505757 RepID=A0ABY6JDE3_9ENTR|nr:DUF2534 family protein [Siccibacter colletis]UYU31850.1 DUF2534 family protein [Siccibacter colletis]WNN48456.1 DUF2534 family protein [Siccibacter colletis]
MREKLRTPEGKKFLLCLVIVFLIAGSVISTVTFEGVEDQYNLPMENWPVSLFIMQGIWTFIYTIVFTILGSLPFGFYFLGPKDDRG